MLFQKIVIHILYEIPVSLKFSKFKNSWKIFLNSWKSQYYTMLKLLLLPKQLWNFEAVLIKTIHMLSIIFEIQRSKCFSNNSLKIYCCLKYQKKYNDYGIKQTTHFILRNHWYPFLSSSYRQFCHIRNPVFGQVLIG